MFATSVFEVGVLLGDRYEIGLSVHPGATVSQADIDETRNVRARFSYHL